MSNQFEEQLEELIHDFEEFDKKLLKGEAFIGKTWEAKNKIKDLLAEGKVIQAKGVLATKLKNIRENKGYNIDNLINDAQTWSRSNISSEEDYEKIGPLIGDPTEWHNGFYTGDQSIDDLTNNDFGKRKRQVGAIVTSQSIPENIGRLFDNVIACYRHGMFEVTVVFCSAIIEGCFYEIVKRNDLLESGQKGIDMDEVIPTEIREIARLYLPKAIYNNACGDMGIKLAKKILHSIEKQDVSEEIALTCIRNTISLIEEVFE